MKQKKIIKILIVEDQTMLSDSLEHIIGEQEDMEVISVSNDAANAPGLCSNLSPDLVLMDVVTKNNSNGITYAAQIRKSMPDIKIVVMTALPEITFVDEARKANLHSFMIKDRGIEHLLYIIRSTMEGHGIYPGPSDSSRFANQFTEREIAVIRLVCQGKTRDKIAKELGISESLLGQHITSILDKSGFDSISKFAIYAAGQGLIVINDP